METKKVKGFKAFDKGMICRGKQYKENEEFVEDVQPEACGKGMHFCPMPLDVLNYYSPIGSEFAEVEATGDAVEREDKVATNKLKIGTKISFSGLFKAHFDIIKEKIEVSKDATSTAGNYAHSSTAGNYAHSSTAGNYAHSSTTGDEAHSSTAGNYAHSSTAGDEAHSSTTGYRAHSSTTGNYAHSSTTGNYAHSSTTGDEAISSALGRESKAIVINGWLILVDWRYDYDTSKWYIHNIHNAKVGTNILDTKIEPNTWYWFEEGNLRKKSI